MNSTPAAGRWIFYCCAYLLFIAGSWNSPGVERRTATAHAEISNGMVTRVMIDDAGTGYTGFPRIMISGGGGSGAWAVVSRMVNGAVGDATMVEGGSGYTSAPTVTIEAPELPTLSIFVSKVVVNMRVTPTGQYRLESSSDLRAWREEGAPFSGITSEREVAVAQIGRYFRIVELSETPRFAPESLGGRSFALANGNLERFVSFGFEQNTYAFEENGQVVESGTWTGWRSGNLWLVETTPTGNGEESKLTFEFTAETAGDYWLEQNGRMMMLGAFSHLAGSPAVVPGRINFTLEESGIGPTTYTVDYTGGNSGTFVISSGGSGRGTFTYTASPTSGRLVMNYVDFPGDWDDFTLVYRAASGSATRSTVTGRQRVLENEYPVRGTFTYVAQ